MSLDCIVVGAGAAGLTAGYELATNGLSYRILEAASGIGGRLKKLDGFTDNPIDLGGEFVNGGQSILSDIAKQDVSGSISTVPYSVDYWEWGGSSFGGPERYNSGYHKFVSYTWFDFFNEFVYPSVSSDVVFDCQVNSVNWADLPVQVSCTNGQVYEANNVIVAVPIKILQNSQISFTPDLPSDTRDAIDNVYVLDGLKAVFKFSSNFYHPSFAIETWQGGYPNEQFYYDQTFGQSTSDNVLSLFALGSAAQPLVGLSDDEIISQVLAQLDSAFSNQASAAFIEGRVQNWSAQPYIQGAYSERGNDRLQSVLDGRLQFAGEAIPVDGKNGYAHGAALSGRRAAQQVTGDGGGGGGGGDSGGGDSGNIGDIINEVASTACFSETATVQVLHRDQPLQMQDLCIGDWVLVDDSQQKPYYEPVYAFAHLDRTTSARFVKFQTDLPGNYDLEMTADHLLFVHGKNVPVRADSIRVGDVLQTATQTGATVAGIDTVVKGGLFAPLTKSGHVIVDGIKVSSYIALQDQPEFVTFHGGLSLGISHHHFVHIALTPFRLVCQQTLQSGRFLASSSVLKGFCHDYDGHGMPSYISASIQTARKVDELPFFWQLCVALLAFFVVVPVFLFVECLVVSATPAALVTGGVLCIACPANSLRKGMKQAS